MNIFERLFKPHYVYRPQQAVLRVLRGVRPPQRPVREIPLPWGPRIRIDVDEDAGREIWRMGLYELAVSEALWRLLGPGDVAVDAGANIGHMTSIMMLRVGRSGRVLSFEPHPELYGELRYNVALFEQYGGTGPVETFEVALSDSSGEGLLVFDDEFENNRGTARLVGNASTGTRVSVRPLDETTNERDVTEIKVLKLDVEGHELQALKGAGQLLRAGKIRNIVYENHEGPESQVHQFLAQLGYSLYEVGWRFGGPVLSPLRSGTVTKAYEPPSYLATLFPEEVLNRFAKRGWGVLRRPRRVASG